MGNKLIRSGVSGSVFAVVLAFFLFSLSLPLAAQESEFSAEQIEFFERKIRPVLVEHCYSCHSAESQKTRGGLTVDSRQALLDGGDSGEAIIPGEPDESLLISAVHYDDYEMPPKGKLADDVIADLEKWVAMGAPWPESDNTPNAAAVEKFDLEKRRDEFWIWTPPVRKEIPTVIQRDWPRSEIDSFILKKLESNRLAPAPDADPLAIARRLHMDLTGLPATLDELKQFEVESKKDKDKAIEALVDRLLASNHFGERWGRHWMDLVRYSESRGHEFDNDIPNAFQYRDYVVRALNADVPYDQIVREHLAGDLLDKPRLNAEQGFNESILGTGFWYMGEWVHSPVDILKDESDRFDNMIDVMSKTFLGVTVSCARCHDHKFDAISTADYYSLTGFLHSSNYRQVRFESLEHNRAIADALDEVDAKFQKKIISYLAQKGIVAPKSRTPNSGEGIVFDFANLLESQYRQDGFSFGKRSRQAGTPYLDSLAGTIKFQTINAATNDPFWNGLESITLGTVQDRNKLTQLDRSGRTLTTPSFEVTTGDVACQVEGEGHIVACVDSHRLVHGPLHGETVVAVKPGQRWVQLKLKRYIGHRVHLEFIPAKGKQLAVRLVTQGMDDRTRNELEQVQNQQDQHYVEFAAKAESIFGGKKLVRDVFADFESGTYEGWTTTGDAFGERPQTLDTIANYQGKINGEGTYFVNSHNVRENGNSNGRGDKPTGTLTSAKFEINFDSIEFLVGGGAHKNKTCVNLIVDGKIERSTTGRNNNQMSQESWDVREFKGRRAQIQVVDNHSGGWGNIGIDHIVFVSQSIKHAPNQEANQLLQQWQQERERLRKQIKLRSHLALAMMDGSGEDGNIYIRGNSSKPGKVEPRHFLTAISGNAPMDIETGSGRLELAEHINDPTNPLTSRVIVNRIWHYLMGRGIVPTTDDFGVLGQRPTHPDLLDHLSLEFLRDGRSIKKMIRRIVLSRTYQMSSYPDALAVEVDPKNNLWHHRPPKRLEGEIIRDQLLALSGNLDQTIGGQPVPIHLTKFMDGRGRPKTNGPLDGNGRRSIYISVRRNFISPFMLAFDTPVPFSTMGRRNVSNVPSQALILMNDPFVSAQARDWAKSLDLNTPAQDNINLMYRSAFGRQPTATELDTAMSFIGNENTIDTWANFAHALVNTKEFIFLR